MWGLTHWDMKIKRLPAGFVVPAQPIKASKPPSGPDWVHEIKHDGYRLIVRRDGPTVRLYTRNAYDWTVRLPAIATAAARINAKSFTIDGEAVVLGPDGLSRFDELRRREAAHSAMLYAFDLIEHDGRDLCDLRFLDRKVPWQAFCAVLRRESCSTSTLWRMGVLFSRTLVGLGQRVSCRWHLSVRSVRGLDQGPEPPASRCGGSAAKRGIVKTVGHAPRRH
jgi:ATP dependent DNA ligase domain